MTLEERIAFEMQRLKEAGLRPTLKACTALSDSLDPYRMHKPKSRRLAQWVAEQFAQYDNRRRIHIRGLHYRFVGVAVDPDGKVYANTEENWDMIQDAVAAARWLGLLPWDVIRDGRNSEADILVPPNWEPTATLRVGQVEIYLPEELKPHWEINGNFIVQPWQQLVVGEKQILLDDVAPICRRYQASLWLPTGEPSAQGLYDLLESANEDGRPLAIHHVGDADPSGYQMSVSIARKVQALVDEHFPDLRVNVYQAALLPRQAGEWDLPDSVLKETEKRAGAWERAFGRAQTELDAALERARRPFLGAIEANLREHWSESAGRRNAELRLQYQEAANEGIEQLLGEDGLRRIEEAARASIAKLEDEVQALNDALDVDPDEAGIETPDLPESELADDVDPDVVPVFTTDDDWMTSTRKLQRRKAYEL